MNTITLKNGLSLSVQYNSSKTGNAMATVASVGKDGKQYPITNYGTAANITTLIELVQQGILQQVVAELVKRGDTTLEKRNAAIQKMAAPIEEARTYKAEEVKSRVKTKAQVSDTEARFAAQDAKIDRLLASVEKLAQIIAE